MFSLLLYLFTFDVVAAEPLRIGMPLGDSELRQKLQLKLTKAYSALGYKPEFIALPSERSLRLLKAGEIDAELFRICQLNVADAELIVVPVELDSLKLNAYGLSQDKMNNWQQRPELLISHIHGFKMAELQQFAGKRVTVKSDNQAFNLMLQGRVDIVLEDSHTAAQFLAMQPNLTHVISQHVADFAVCHVVHHSLQSVLPELIPQLQ